MPQGKTPFSLTIEMAVRFYSRTAAGSTFVFAAELAMDIESSAI